MGLYMFCFDDSLEAKVFEKEINKVLTDYSLTTLGHVKEHYGVKTVDSDYADYIMVKPKFYFNKNNKTYYEYARSYIKPGLGEIHWCVAVKSQGLRELTYDGQLNYPQYDISGNLIKKESYIDDLKGLEMLAAAIIERAAIETTDRKGQEWWETEWCKELFHKDDIDPIKVRNQINKNRKEYGSWKVPWDVENASDDPRSLNRSAVRCAKPEYVNRKPRKKKTSDIFT